MRRVRGGGVGVVGHAAQAHDHGGVEGVDEVGVVAGESDQGRGGRGAGDGAEGLGGVGGALEAVEVEVPGRGGERSEEFDGLLGLAGAEALGGVVVVDDDALGGAIEACADGSPYGAESAEAAVGPGLEDGVEACGLGVLACGVAADEDDGVGRVVLCALLGDVVGDGGKSGEPAEAGGVLDEVERVGLARRRGWRLEGRFGLDQVEPALKRPHRPRGVASRGRRVRG